jgi:hypothetical protein
MWRLSIVLMWAALVVQAVIILAGILGTLDFAKTYRYPVGSAYRAYYWSSSISFLMFLLVVGCLFARYRSAHVKLWTCFVVVAVSLLMVYMAEVATGSVVYRK